MTAVQIKSVVFGVAAMVSLAVVTVTEPGSRSSIIATFVLAFCIGVLASNPFLGG